MEKEVKQQPKALENAHKVIDEIYELAKKAKDKYDSTDEKTKKKIIGGLVGAAALITGVIGLKSKMNKKDEENKTL